MSTQVRLSRMATRIILLISLFLAILEAAPHRVLFITHSAGFRHDSIAVSILALKDIGARSGRFEVVASEDLNLISSESLRTFAAVLFFTSGELALQPSQKQALLDFVRRGGGFAGFHSATDTLYQWPEYGELIGGRFDGHPWTQAAKIRVEDSEHPASRGFESPWTLTEEYYQFRDFSRDRVRVLMSLDTSSVDLRATGAHQNTSDFPLMWTRTYGDGRVLYSALGHFDETWRDVRVQRSLAGAMEWILRDANVPIFAERGVGNAATMEPRDTISPGSLISIYGTDFPLSAVVRLDANPLPVIYASARQLNALVPLTFKTQNSTARLDVSGSTGLLTSRDVQIAQTTPGIFAVSTFPGAFTIWATGLGVELKDVVATIAGQPAKVLFAGVSPEFPGLQQINVEISATAPRGRQQVGVAPSSSAPFVFISADLPPN